MLLAPAMTGQQIYDLLLKNGHVIDSVNHRNDRFDVAVIGNKIARVARDLPASQARVAIDASQYYVTAGLIDINARFSADHPENGVRPDTRCLPNGVTTAVDAGTRTWQSFEVFKTSVIDRSKTRVLAFLNIGPAGDTAETARMVRRYPQAIIGVSAAPSVDLAVKAAELSNSIVMADLEALNRLRPGDIVTHIYAKNPKVWMEPARKRGILFDGGYSSRGFLFSVAAPAIRQGLVPDTISSGIENSEDLLPLAGMMDSMSKLLNMGMSVEQIIDRATANPARGIRRPDLGSLSEGAVADIALLEVQRGRFGFLDSSQAKLVGDKRLRCVLTVRNGAILWDSEGLAAADWIKAGPYSNYK
jgi:dihydroorotase